MEPNAAAPPQGSSVFPARIVLDNPIPGTVTIASDGSLSISGTSDVQAQGHVLTFDPRSDGSFYSLTLLPPPGWSWDPSSSLQYFQGDDNVCGFYSNFSSIQAFNSSESQTAQVLNVLLNLLDGDSNPAPRTISLHFPTPSSSTEPSGDSFDPQPIPGNPVTGGISGSVQGGTTAVTGIQWTGSGTGWSTEDTPSGGQFTFKPSMNQDRAWNLSLEVSGNHWEMGEAPAFEVSPASNSNCGVVFMGPHLKAYSALPENGIRQSFTLALKLTNTQSSVNQWLGDPAVVFDPPDPSGIE